MSIELKNNFFRLMEQERVCDQCGAFFETWEGYCSEHDSVVVCSDECLAAWCMEKTTNPSALPDTGRINPADPWSLSHGDAGADRKANL